uniref:Uncharacterized protein n=1 Tax=Oryza brachyantha TaxID=4533 RepID=J3N624_ORYBR
MAASAWLLLLHVHAWQLLFSCLVVLHGRAGAAVVVGRVVVVGVGGGGGDAERRRHVRRRGAAEQRPVDAVEKRVPLDRRRADRGAETPGRVLGEERRDEVLGGGRHGRLLGELEGARHDVGQGHLVVVALERRHAVEELEHEDAQRPPVHGAAVPLAGHDLRGKVLVRANERHRPELHGLGHELQLEPTGGEVDRSSTGSATNSSSSPPPGKPLPARLDGFFRPRRDDTRRGLGGVAGEGDGVRDDVRRRRRRRVALEREVEVGEHDVAIGADEHVLRLEVPVHDVHHVDVLQRRHHLRRVEPTQHPTLSSPLTSSKQNIIFFPNHLTATMQQKQIGHARCIPLQILH